MKRSIRIITLFLALTAFALMAVGSGSSSSSDQKNSPAPPAVEEKNTNAESSPTKPVSNPTESKVPNTKSAPDETAEPPATKPQPTIPEPTEPELVSSYELGEILITTSQNSLGMNSLTLAIPVINTGNTNLYLGVSSVDIESASGVLQDTIKRLSGYPEVLAPGETGYYYHDGLYDGKELSGLKAIPHLKINPATIDMIRFNISDVQISDGAIGGAKIIGRAENNTSQEEPLIYVVANLFDSNKSFIGQAFTIMASIMPAGEKMGFEMSMLTSDIKASDIASYEIYAFPHQLQIDF